MMRIAETMKDHLARLKEAIHGISDRRQAENAHRQLIEQLIQSNTELERFAYVASHDMQEPLRMIANFSEIIATDYKSKLDSTGREYLELITDSAMRIQHMIDDLLEYARIGSQNAQATKVNASLELQHVLANLRALIEDSGAKITHEALPEFYGNPIQFMRLVQNIICNAIKYQPPGNVPQIHISTQDRGGMWCIAIRDNGIGIDEEFTREIFEPFRRLHSWDDIKGSGIGLAVCSKIVKNHGGDIWVESVPGKGSTFCFTVPKMLQAQEAA